MHIYLFPGQGSQRKGMGAILFDEFPELVQKADDILGYSIKRLCLEDPNNTLNQTKYTQPALYVINALSYEAEIKKTNNQLPDYCIGHSLGEYSALYAAGALSFSDGLKLVKKRGELMSQARKGAMAAILNIEANAIKGCLLNNDLSNISIANYNTASQLVISGLQDDIFTSRKHLEEIGATFIPLNTSGAFHSHYMMDARQKFAQYVATFKFSTFRCPVIANITARPYEQNKIPEILSQQITDSIKWQESIEYLLSQGGNEFKELGSGNILSKMVNTIKVDYVKSPSINKPLFTDVKQRISYWNSNHPVGSQVKVKGYQQLLETQTKAMVLFGHRAAVYMKNYNGYFDLDDVEPV